MEIFIKNNHNRKPAKTLMPAYIMQEFYANDIDIYEKSIRNLVFKLRKKLPEKMISSIYGMGYILTPTVH